MKMLLSLVFLAGVLFTTCASQGNSQSGQSGQSSNSCDACCQGMPGHNGQNGPPGVRGEKGDQGEPGVSYGIKGAKGDQGITPVIDKVAFTARMQSEQTGDVNDVMQFDQVLTNLNDDFDLSTNVFTCTVPGVYVFSAAILSYRPNAPMVHMVKNDGMVMTLHARTHTISNDVDQATNMVVLKLEAEDRVWLKFALAGSFVHGASWAQYNTFTGFLLYKD